MSELDRLNAWMTKNSFTIRKLATETGMSYDGMYQILRVREQVSPGFKLRFIARFGDEAASEIFDQPSVPAMV